MSFLCFFFFSGILLFLCYYNLVGVFNEARAPHADVWSAFRIFPRLQVTVLNVFFVFLRFLWHTSFPFLRLLFSLCQWRRITIARPRPYLWGLSHPSGSICPFCALAFGSLTLRRAHSFCSSVCSLKLFFINIYAKSLNVLTE